MVVFEAHVVRRATFHKFEMLATLNEHVRAIVNASVLKGEATTFEGIFVA